MKKVHHQIVNCQLSIVIPVYNVVAYLRRCVSSLQQYVGCSYEIILVDDGSTDGSASLCDELATSYEHIIVVHQTNKGVSAARNVGIDKACGEWLWFVDADDYIEQPLTLSMVSTESNMVVLGCLWDENAHVVAMPATTTDMPYNTWRCLFRRNVIMERKVRFVVGRCYAEDQEFIISYLLSVPRWYIVTIDDFVYHYTIRVGSAMSQQGRKGQMLFDIIAVWCNVMRMALASGGITKVWLWRELKRIAKSFIIAVVR